MNFPQDRLAPDRSSTSIALARKNPVVALSVAGTSLPVQQGFRENQMNGYGPLRTLGLARTDYSIHDRGGNVHVSLAKIDVTPLQAEHLALSQPVEAASRMSKFSTNALISRARGQLGVYGGLHSDELGKWDCGQTTHIGRMIEENEH
jgi:hypothetical protein